MLLNFHGISKWIRGLADNKGLTLQYTDEDQPCTDGKTIYVPRPQAAWSEDDLLLWKYKVLHETGHNDKDMRDIFNVIRREDVDMSSFFGHVLNVLDDHRQEYHKHDKYEGNRAIMSKGRGMFLMNQVGGMHGSETPEQAVATAIYTWDSCTRTDFQPEVISAAIALEAQLTPQARVHFDKLVASGMKYVTRNTTGKEEYQIACDLIEFLGIDLDTSKEAGDGGAEGPPKAGYGDGDEFEGYLVHDHSKDDGSDGGYATDESYGMPHDTSIGEYTPVDTIRVVDCVNVTRCGGSSALNKIHNTRSTSGGLANTVRKLLQVRAQTRYEHGKKKGKIGKSLYRACIPDAGSYGSKVFKQKVGAPSLDTSVLLLVDMSGSMRHNNRWGIAGRAACLLNEAIAKLGIPMAVVGFTEEEEGPVHYMFKDFKDKVSTVTMENSFSYVSERMANNADGESILWAYNMLQGQKSTRKVLITLSDGEPAAYRSGITKFTQDVTKAIIKNGNVELYGIGIESSAVEEFYPDNTVINTASELEQALITVIKTKLL